MYPEELVDTELFKVFGADFVHHDFQYREDIVNRLAVPFAREGSGVPGGFYFTTRDYIRCFLSFGERIHRVHVPFYHPECLVVKDPTGNKYRTNMLMLGEKCTVEEMFSMVPLVLLLSWAADSNQQDVFDHWTNQGKPRLISMDQASALGLVNVLEWRKNSGLKCEWTCVAIDAATRNCHVQVLEWWKNSGLNCEWSMWSKSSLQSMIVEKMNADSFEDSMNSVSGKKLVATIKWWETSKTPETMTFHINAMDIASQRGLTAVLEWWKNSELECEWTTHAMEFASRNGHVHVLEWWKNSGLECKFDRSAMDFASRNGHIQVLEWWKNSKLGCKFSNLSMNWASREGHIQVLEWWKSSGLDCKWSRRAIVWAENKCHVDVIKWWKNSGLPTSLSTNQN